MLTWFIIMGMLLGIKKHRGLLSVKGGKAGGSKSKKDAATSFFFQIYFIQ